MNIHDKITELRTARRWSLCRLAKEACIPLTTVYNWYNENHFTPSRDKIEDLCAAFKISVAEFYADIEPNALTGQELHLLELYRKLPEKNKEKAISLLEMLIE